MHYLFKIYAKIMFTFLIYYGKIACVRIYELFILNIFRHRGYGILY